MFKNIHCCSTIRFFIAASMLFSSGCKTGNAVDSVAAALASPASESAEQEASENVAWHVAPSISATDVRMIYPIMGDWESYTGYPQEWYDTGYSDNAVMIITNGWGRIMDFDGNTLNATDINMSATQGDKYDARGSALLYGSDDYGTGYIYVGNDYNYYLSQDFASISGTVPVGACDCGDDPTVTETPAIVDNTFGTYRFGYTETEEVQEFLPGEMSSFTLSDRNIVPVRGNDYFITGYGIVDQNGEIIYTSSHLVNGEATDYPTIVNNRFFETDREIDSSHYTYFFDIPYETEIKDLDNTKKIALVNAETGEHLTDYLYDEALYFEDGYCPVEKDGKWGFIDENGNEVTDFIFDSASALYQGLTYVSVNDCFGVLDLKATLEQGTPVNLSTCYDSVGGVPDSSAELRIQGSVTTSYDNVNIRSGAGTSYDKLGHMGMFWYYPVYETQEAEDYTWLRIGDNEWVANDGTDSITRFITD